jgi:phosphonate transport system substrate-binding protein
MVFLGQVYRRLFCLSLIPAVIAFWSPAQAASDKTFYFGIVPQQSASRLAKMWIPLMDRLSEKTGLTIRFATTKDIPTFESCLAQGAYELAYMNPYHYTVFHGQKGYEAFAHQSDKKLKGLVVVRKDNPARFLKDLDGQTFAFPSPAAFGASVLPRAEMRKSGINHTPQYVKSHDSVYRSVVAGLHVAGGGVTRTFNAAPEALRSQLRIIYETKGYTPHAFAARPDVQKETRDRISTALLEIAKENPELVKGIGMQGFVPAQDRDWDDVRALGLSQKATEVIRGGSAVCRSD